MDTLNFATQIARQTGKLLLAHYRRSGIRASLKADHTVVTEADLAADCLIRQAIREHYPDDGLLSEEEGTIYPAGKSAVWIVDPLDGTTNFSLGMHYWGISIARLVDGEPDTAALYFPLLDELFTASRGGGAYLNGSRLEVKPPAPDQASQRVSESASRPNPGQAMFVFSCCSRTHANYKVSIRYKTRILGSAAYGLCTVARGSAVLAFEVTPKVWDFCGSWLVTREAGGVIRVLDGGTPFPLIPGTDYEGMSYPILAAATPELWAEGQGKIIPKT
ncbi:MAG: hypothetical protein KKD28_03670 [Chloroflexi bacterium]|nr:hypothetical protein [Chloroflexota bacterium]